MATILDKIQRLRSQRETGPPEDSLLVYPWTFTFYFKINLLNFTVTHFFFLTWSKILDRTEMYNFWSVFSRNIIGKRVAWSIWLEVFATFYSLSPSIRAQSRFKECFVLPVLILMCFDSSTQQVISFGLLCTLWMATEWSCNQALFCPLAFILGCTFPSLVPFLTPWWPDLMHQNSSLGIKMQKRKGKRC